MWAPRLPHWRTRGWRISRRSLRPRTPMTRQRQLKSWLRSTSFRPSLLESNITGISSGCCIRRRRLIDSTLDSPYERQRTFGLAFLRERKLLVYHQVGDTVNRTYQ
ncbi:hypothetical protein LY78DRAFT_698114 [Colletotrichum sublineola]|nr:hypothetical protein LY78DRAFT_698114 [Colletotrichum sublineola]